MIDAMGVIAWVSHGRGADAEHGPPRQWSSDLKLLRECGVPSEARARPSDDGCVQPRRRPHTEVRRVSTAVTTLCRGARNTANHQTGRYPPYQWFNRKEQDAHTDSERLSSPAAYSVVSALPSRTTTQCGTRHCTINVLTLEEDEGGWATSMATKRSRIW